MERKSQKDHVPTSEEIWKILRETEQIVRENAISLKETERIVKETALQMKETDRKMQETDRLMQETDRQMKETDRQMKETDRQMKETDRKMQETDRRFKAIQQEIGGISKSSGEFAEEYFYNTFDNGEPLEFAGERFDAIEKNIHGSAPGVNRRDEYDLILRNGSKIAIIETKYKCREDNIEEVLKKADSFRFWYPKYKKHKIYLGLAALTFDRKTMEKAQEKGIAIIRQRGGKTVVYDKGLKAY